MGVANYSLLVGYALTGRLYTHTAGCGDTTLNVTRVVCYSKNVIAKYITKKLYAVLHRRVWNAYIGSDYTRTDKFIITETEKGGHIHVSGVYRGWLVPISFTGELTKSGIPEPDTAVVEKAVATCPDVIQQRVEWRLPTGGIKYPFILLPEICIDPALRITIGSYVGSYMGVGSPSSTKKDGNVVFANRAIVMFRGLEVDELTVNDYIQIATATRHILLRPDSWVKDSAVWCFSLEA